MTVRWPRCVAHIAAGTGLRKELPWLGQPLSAAMPGLIPTPSCPTLQLASVPHLESLDLSGCGAVTADGLASALESLPELRRLTLDSLPCIDDGSLAVLAPRLSGLMALSIAR